MGYLDKTFGQMEDDQEVGKEWEQPKPEPTLAVVAGVWDIGIQPSQFGEKRQCCVVMELDQRDSKGARFQVHAAMSYSMFEKAPLYRLVCEALPGQDHTNLTIKALVGKTVFVGLLTDKRGKVQLDKDAIMQRPRQMPDLAVEGDYKQPTKLVTWFLNRATKRNDVKVQEEKAKSSTPAGDDIPF
jgi:hypothetical protein